HDSLMCIAQGRAVADTERKRLTPHHYFRPAAEMRALFADLPEACDNTLVIARRCAFIPRFRKPILPAFNAAGGAAETDEPAVLRDAARAGLAARLASPTLALADHQPYRDRLEFELETIIQM